MINKQQWVVLPYKVIKTFKDLRLSPPGVVPQRGRRPRWIVDYTWWKVNDETLPLAPSEAMQFGHALDRILRELLLADPKLGPLYMLKLDISNSFYRINLATNNIPRLGVVFPVKPGAEPLVAFPLVLPMGWKNSPPIFSAATKTAADIANCDIQSIAPVPPHPLGQLAATMDDPIMPAPRSRPTGLPSAQPSPIVPTTSHLPHPVSRDTSLPTTNTSLTYVDVFVDDFIGLCQGRNNCLGVCDILLRAVDQVFRPNDFHDDSFRREPVSLKKLKKGDVSWSTIKTVLGWVINTSTMTIHLPEHRVQCLAEILFSIPSTQKRLSIKKWHKVIGELRSMSLALPGARNMFSMMQHALATNTRMRVALTKGVHQALTDFCWMFNDIASHGTPPVLPN